MRPHLTIAALALLAASPAFAQSASPAPADLPAPADSEIDAATFSQAVASAGQFEIESSKLAETRNVSADVKDFATLMVKDHTMVGEDFDAALDQSQTTASIAPSGPALLPKDQAMLDQLKALDGDEFQARYIVLQGEAHKQAVALFSTYAQSGDDPALKEFAKKTLPMLQMHEMHVKDLAAAHSG